MTIDIAKDFEHFFDDEHRAIATITQDHGAGRYAAKTESNAKLILKGIAKVGDKVFYDAHTLHILEIAPSVTFVDIPV